ncbi:MAG TPA: hypothetical protein VFW92_08530 [Candidatus Limnocylindrales bacterium]|nr:hypothetical protein [Candidatus Limnocylindrales bacterium]
MTDLDAMLLPPPPDSAQTIVAPTPRRHRHDWVRCGPDYEPESYYGHPEDFGRDRCHICLLWRDPARSRRGRTSRNRGNRTSRDLAAYLGGRNVEALKVPWDVEGPGYRIQSKRLADRPSASERARLLEAIDHRADDLRAVYIAAPRQRIASGTVSAYLADWVAWHGWDAPPGLSVVRGSGWLLELSLSLFRDLHIGRNP